jgi:ectoine hydroxylase-related dioxygenase (phytanoyl-CoA dioxygenase family)
VYLDESNEANGCLYVIPGSHLAGPLPEDRRRQVIDSWTRGRTTDAPGAIPVIARPGDVVVHATTVLHGSFENTSDSMRRTVYYHCDHLADVKLAGDQWPQRDFPKALQQTRAAVDLRRKRFPDEQAFDYRVGVDV